MTKSSLNFKTNILELSKKVARWPGKLQTLTAALIFVLLTINLLPQQSANAETLSVSNGLFRSYAVLGSPKHVVVETPDRIWFTAPDADAIGLLTVIEVTDQVIEYHTRYFLTGAGSKPYDLVLHQGAIWFTLAGANALGKLVIATETLTQYPLSPGSEPRGIAVNPVDGTIWCVTRTGNALVKFDPIATTAEEFPYPVADAGLEDVTFGGDNVVWMTSTTRNEVRQFDLTTGQFQLAVPTGSDGAPISVVVDVLNYPWVTFSSTGDIGRYAPGTLALWRRFAAPMSAGQPAGLHIRGDSFSQQVWYTLTAGGAVGYFRTRNSGQLMTPHLNFPLPGRNSSPWGVTVSADGVVWIADSGANQLVEWLPPYYEPLYLPAIAR